MRLKFRTLKLRTAIVDKLNVVKESIPKENWKFYHFESVENFALHIESIKNERRKKKAYSDLFEYLDVVSRSAKDANLRQTYRDLFSNYIYNIAGIYKDELGFISKPSFPLLFGLIAVLFVIVWFLTNLRASISIIAIVSAVILFYYVYKLRAKKYY